jgi:fatty-acyl-CoA synthase
MSGPDRSAGANVGSWIQARAALHPNRVAVHVEGTGEELSYADLQSLTNRIAQLLREIGVRPGDRVALAFQLEDSEPRVVLRHSDIAMHDYAAARVLTPDELRSRLPERDDEPPLAPGGEAAHVLLYTSGTTGVPRGATLPHRKTVFNTLNAEIYFELEERDVVVVPVPLFHSYGLKILSVPALFAGATIVLVDHFDPVGIQETVARHRATLLGGVPVMYQRMLRPGVDPERLASLRFAFCAGAPLNAEIVRAFHERDVALVQGYGQTETSILCCLDRAHALPKAGSVGRPVRYGEIRIVNEDGKPVPTGTSGEIVVRGPILMLGYWRRPEETEAARLDGWHQTGDLGRMDDEGFVTLVGRRKEMYISGGENVYPAEVERILEQHPSVAECAVIGVPDREWGETGCAFIVPLKPPFDSAELIRWARERLAGYKLPRQIRLTKRLPRTASGKVQKHRLDQDSGGS